MKERNSIKKVAVTSILVAAAVILDILIRYVPGLNYSMPQGGSPFGISMVPLVMLALVFGVYYGIIGGVVFGLVNFMLDGYAFHWGSFLFDYILAFGLIGLVGLFKGGLNNKKTAIIAVLIAGLLRYLSHSLGGVLFFADYAPDGTHPLVYSFIIYNLPYMLPSTIISMIILILIRKRMNDVIVDGGFISHKDY